MFILFLRKWAVFAAAFSIGVTVNNSVFSAGSESTYGQLSGDLSISGNNRVLLSSTITLPAAAYVYVQSDGRVYPSGAAIAALSIVADGQSISNDSIVDWSQTSNAQQHSYNIIGGKYLSAGTHVLQLIASTLNGAAFMVGAGSNLAVMTAPAENVNISQLGSDTSTLSFNTAGIVRGMPLPHQALISQSLNPGGQPVISLASGRIYLAGSYGDPLTSIYLNGREPENNIGSWSDNDMYKGAENQAPFYNQAFYAQLTGPSTISWDASALAYCEDNSCSGLVNHVQYKAGANSTLVTLYGGMSVVGSASTSNDAYNRTNYIGVGSSSGWPGVPSTGADVALAQATIVVPAGHNGIVLISGKSRVQGDTADTGTVSMWITVDGVRRGSTGIQQLSNPDGVSTRTIGASYLSANPGERLAPGTHQITLYGRADGTFKHLAMTRDLPLIWFD
ncbi:hypothetical protein [Burkholderia singularis]|uniref:Uncharacterized protein n=1 Tax=Burkholderia singularis TaxID=1503053 RepID=A0A238H8B3_9BURK|nr:hypothetical protein [Burkholderia singularis]SMG01325.1 hypothetical protein BSIN_0541 [Burkholderia singularis]